MSEVIDVLVQAPRDTTFYYVSMLTARLLRKYYGVEARVVWNRSNVDSCVFIGDISQLLHQPDRCDYGWVDSCYSPKVVHAWVEVHKWWRGMATTSVHNARILEWLGLRNPMVIPRPINEELFKPLPTKEEYERRPYGFFMVGRKYNPERKNLWIADLVSSYFHVRGAVITPNELQSPLVRRFDSGVSDKFKLRLLRASKVALFLSSAEGFGMPPIEAMASGTVLVYGDMPAVNEWAVGIPVKPADYTLVDLPYQTAVLYHYDPKDVLEAVDYALSMSWEERYNLLSYAQEVAVRIQNQAIEGAGKLLGLGKPYKEFVLNTGLND